MTRKTVLGNARVRMSPALHKQLSAAAIANERSLNAEIVQRLESTLLSDGTGGPMDLPSDAPFLDGDIREKFPDYQWTMLSAAQVLHLVPSLKGLPPRAVLALMRYIGLRPQATALEVAKSFSENDPRLPPGEKTKQSLLAWRRFILTQDSPHGLYREGWIAGYREAMKEARSKVFSIDLGVDAAVAFDQSLFIRSTTPSSTVSP